MFTDALPTPHLPDAEHMGLGLFKLAIERVHSAVCGLHGHDLVLHFERGRRVCLRCTNCGHETPGWTTK